MADLNIRLHIRISRPMFRWGLVGLFLSALAPELATESVTLSTYYPAPSGVYTQMITTNNTFLARDGGVVGVRTTSVGGTGVMAIMGGSVGIGVTNPDTNLQVAGNGSGMGRMGEGWCGGNYTGLSLNGQAPGGAGLCANYNVLSSPTDPDLYLNRPSGQAIHLREANGEQMILASGGLTGVGGIWPTAAMDVNGDLRIRRASNCSWFNYSNGTQSCGSGYITMTDGLYSVWWALGYQPTTANDGVAICCTCPPGGC